MAKYLVMVGRLSVSGSHRHEVGTFLLDVAVTSLTDPEVAPHVEDVLHVPIARVPTPCARNELVKQAKKNKIDFLFMVDDDMNVPPGFFKRAFLHLMNWPTPTAIGVPYCCGSNHQQVQVFDFASPGNHEQTSFKLEHIPREDAARRTGVEQVANIGTGCIAYHMKCFTAFETRNRSKVYFDYAYDADHTNTVETEDCYFHRHLYFANVPLFVSWDHWAGHIKSTTIDKPYVLERHDIERVYLEQAKGFLKNHGQKE